MGTEPANPVSVSVDQAALPPFDVALLHMARVKFSNTIARTLYTWLSRISVGGGGKYPGPTAMAKLCGSTRFTVSRAEKQLVERGLVTFSGPDGEKEYRLTDIGPLPTEQLAGWQLVVGTANPERSLEVKKKPRKTKVKEAEPDIPPDPAPVENSDGAADAISSKPEETKEQANSETKPARSKLTQADIAKICSSLDSMRTYLLWGKDALYTPGVYPHATCSWRKFMTPEDTQEMHVPKWETNTFMGYFWFNVSIYRDKRGIPLNLPAWSRLAGDVKNLRKTMTNWQLFMQILTTTQWFDVIKWMSGKAGLSLELNETSLTHGMIKSAANSIGSMSEEGRSQLLERFNKETQRK
jgi:hypothetical protein